MCKPTLRHLLSIWGRPFDPLKSKKAPSNLLVMLEAFKNSAENPVAVRVKNRQSVHALRSQYILGSFQAAISPDSVGSKVHVHQRSPLLLPARASAKPVRVHTPSSHQAIKPSPHRLYSRRVPRRLHLPVPVALVSAVATYRARRARLRRR